MRAGFAMIAILIVLAGLLIFSVRRNLLLSRKLKEKYRADEKEREAATKRAEVEGKANEKRNDILSSDRVDHGVLPDGEIVEHNHTFNQPCLEDCPAYNKP